MLIDCMQNGAMTLECSVESMELGEGNFTAVVVVRDEALYRQTDPQVVSEVSLTLRVFVAPRSALIVFPNTDVQVSVLAGEVPSWAPLTFANFGKTNAGGVDTCSADNTLTFSIERAEGSGEGVQEWVQLMPEETELKYVGMETKVLLNFTKAFVVSALTRSDRFGPQVERKRV